jgi:hypothetical protein
MANLDPFDVSYPSLVCNQFHLVCLRSFPIPYVDDRDYSLIDPNQLGILWRLHCVCHYPVNGGILTLTATRSPENTK